MEQILVVGDPHFKHNNRIETDKLLEDIVSMIKIKSIDIVVVLGDIMNDHEKIDLKVFKRVEKFITEISDLTQIYILIGNHDRVNNKVFLTDEHVFGPYKRWKNVYIVDDHCPVITWKNLNICLAPFVPDGRFMEALNISKIDLTKIDLIFCHQEFTNCSINKITKSKCDEWLPHYPLIISGHIHHYEISSDNLIYLGTPFQHNFGDNPNNRGIFLLNESMEIEFHELSIPKKIVIEVDYKDIDEIELNNRDKFKILIRGPKNIVKDILQNRSYQEKFSGVKIVFVDETENVKTKRQNRQFKKTMTFLDRLSYSLKQNEEMNEIFHFFFSEDQS